MLKQHKDLLMTKYVVLSENLCVDEIFLSYLRSQRIITEYQEEELMSFPTRSQRACHIVNLLQRRGPSAFQAFVEAMMHTEQDFLAKDLDPQIAETWLRTHPRVPTVPITRPHVQPGFYGNIPAHLNPPPYPYVVYNTQAYGNNPWVGHRTTGNQIVTQPEEEAQVPVGPPKKIPFTFQPSIGNNPSPESAMLNIDVPSVNLHDPQILSLISNTQDVYRMSSKPRGRAIIVNNEFFTAELGERSGSMWDYVNLDMLFIKLGFKTDNWSNLTGAEFLKRLMEEKENKEHVLSDAFIMVIMSHGIRGSVYGTDGNKISIEDHILQAFNGKNCPGLFGKPKLFFIQACQGHDVTSGFVVPDAPDVEYEALMDKFKELQLQDNTDSVPTLPQDAEKRHEMADILLAYSTAPGYKSWRHPETGTWFVRELVKVCNEFAHEDDLMDILRKVRQRVVQKETDKGYKQITRTDDMLTKKFYFFPGYYNT